MYLDKDYNQLSEPDYYSSYLEFFNLTDRFKTLGIDINRALDYNCFIEITKFIDSVFKDYETKEGGIITILTNPEEFNKELKNRFKEADITIKYFEG